MRITFDIKLRRPACPILAAFHGGNIHIPHLFDVETWLISPTDNMKTYEITEEELHQLVKKVEGWQKQRARK